MTELETARQRIETYRNCGHPLVPTAMWLLSEVGVLESRYEALLRTHEIVRDDLRTRLATAEAEVERLRNACSAQNDAICQTLGRALGYPDLPESGGVCVGDHVAESLATEAARKLERKS